MTSLPPIDLTRRIRRLLLLLPAVTAGVWGIAVLLLNLPEEERLPAFLCLPALVALMCGTMLVLTLAGGSLIISAQGVTVARRGSTFEYPWADYHHLFRLTGRKAEFLLLSDAWLDESAQLAAFHACRRARQGFHPIRTADGCLLLDPMLAEKEILRRLPAQIEVVPAARCARL